MGTDGGTDVVNQEMFKAKTLLYLIPDILRILQTVAVADKDIVIGIFLFPGVPE